MKHFITILLLAFLLPAIANANDYEDVGTHDAINGTVFKSSQTTATPEGSNPSLYGFEEEDPYATGYWVVFINKDGTPYYYEVYEVPHYAISLNYGYSTPTSPDDDANFVAFYFLIDGVRYGAAENGTEPIYDDANPLVMGDNCWKVPFGYKYEIYIYDYGNWKMSISRQGICDGHVSWGYDFENEGIYYKIESDNEVSVSYKKETYRTDGGGWYEEYILYSGYNGDVNIPETVTHNGTTYTVTSINYRAFESSSITSVSIPNTVTTIGESAFEKSAIISISIPNSVTSIGVRAFVDCSELTIVTIPNSVTNIGGWAFAECNALTDVYCYILDPTMVATDDIFYTHSNFPAERTLHVPFGTGDIYRSNEIWYCFDHIVEMLPEIPVTSIALDTSVASMTPAEALQLTATVLPEDAICKTVNWTSSNTTVATVDDSGLVTAIAPGFVTIIATTTDGTNLSATCEVTVSAVSVDNYFTIPDTTVMHGETIVIPVAMTNSESIISFQTDIFLPEGIELLQEDGEYLIDPSERMTRSHSIMSDAVSNGAIRVLCYSSSYKPFTGNSGDDLFYITVKVADDAEGDYTIALRNTYLTTSNFDEITAPDVTANVNVKAYLLGDANNSGTVTVTDVVVTSQYILERDPQPFIFDAADVNFDGNITVTDVSRIAWMVLNPALNAPRRAPAVWNNGDRLSCEDFAILPGQTRTVALALDNEMVYSAFQLDLKLPAGLKACNFALTGRAGSHALDVNTLACGDIRALCYSPVLTAIAGNEGALLTFDVTATGAIAGDIVVDGIELVTDASQTVKLDAFAIGVNTATSVNELTEGKTVSRIDYYNAAGQRLDRPVTGVNIVVTTYTDGTRRVTKLLQ